VLDKVHNADRPAAGEVRATRATDAEGISAEILEKLIHSVGKDPIVAKDHDWLAATVFALRDRIIDRWIATTRASNESPGRASPEVSVCSRRTVSTVPGDMSSVGPETSSQDVLNPTRTQNAISARAANQGHLRAFRSSNTSSSTEPPRLVFHALRVPRRVPGEGLVDKYFIKNELRKTVGRLRRCSFR